MTDTQIDLLPFCEQDDECRHVFEHTWKDNATFVPWPAEQPILGEVECPECEVIECYDCDGSGFAVIECYDCDGSGFAECDMGHNHDCETCDGEGILRSKKCVCKGTGYVKGPARQQIGKQQIDIKYDRLIRALPGPVEWAANGAAILCRFNGGRGIVMAFSDNLKNES